MSCWSFMDQLHGTFKWFTDISIIKAIWHVSVWSLLSDSVSLCDKSAVFGKNCGISAKNYSFAVNSEMKLKESDENLVFRRINVPFYKITPCKTWDPPSNSSYLKELFNTTILVTKLHLIHLSFPWGKSGLLPDLQEIKFYRTIRQTSAWKRINCVTF